METMLFLRTITQGPEKWGPESEEESLLTMVIIVFGIFPKIESFYFQEQSADRKLMSSAQVISHNFVCKTDFSETEILQEKEEEAFEMTTSPDSSTLSQVKVHRICF